MSYEATATDRLVDIVLRHQSGSYLEVADRLAKQLKLNARDKLKLKQRLQHALEGHYSPVVLVKELR